MIRFLANIVYLSRDRPVVGSAGGNVNGAGSATARMHAFLVFWKCYFL